MINELTEILIGKYLDSEITPAEQRLLQTELDNNPDAQQWLDAIEQLRQHTEQALQQELSDSGRSVENIFNTAIDEVRKTDPTPIKLPTWFRMTASLAAGFMLGLAAFWVWTSIMVPKPQIPTQPTTQPIVAQNNPNTDQQPQQNPQRPQPDHNRDNNINRTNRQWLIEDYRDNNLAPAGYHGDL